MAWTVAVHLDDDKDDVGSVSATWNSGEPDEFTYSRRAKCAGDDLRAFVAEAQKGLAARGTLKTKAASLETALAAELNKAVK